MKKSISTLIALGFVASMLVNTAYAGDHQISILNPLWVPVAILSTVAATVTAIVQPAAVYEYRGYPEPRQTIIYEEPRHYRHNHSSERSYIEHERSYGESRYRNYR